MTRAVEIVTIYLQIQIVEDLVKETSKRGIAVSLRVVSAASILQQLLGKLEVKTWKLLHQVRHTKKEDTQAFLDS